MEAKVDDVLKFLDDWKCAVEIKSKFEMSDTETYHLLRWLKKGNYVECFKAGTINMAREVDNRKFYYKAK